MHLRIRQIRYFVEIVNAGSMSKAAARLNLVPNALSLQVKSLEENFGIRLLTRHAHGVLPTGAGKLLYDKSQMILGLLEVTERDLASNSMPRVTYRMGVMPSVAHAVGLEALRAANDLKKGIRISLVEAVSEDLCARLRAGELDFVIGWNVSGAPFGHAIDILEEELVFVTSSLAGFPRNEVTLSEALSADLIRFGKEDRAWGMVDRAAAAEGLQLKSAHVVESADLLRRMLCSGMGSAILPVGLVEEEWRENKVSVRRISCEGLRRRISFLWRESWSTSADRDTVLRYVDGVVASLHQMTAPFSEILATVLPISRPSAE